MTVKCPKCKAVQGDTTQCRFCGTDFNQKPDGSLPQNPVVLELVKFYLKLAQIYQKIAAFPPAFKKRWLAQVDRLSAKIGIDLAAVFNAAWQTVRSWFRDVLDLIATILVCAFFAWVICVVLLSISEGLWALYLETQVGQQFLLHFPFRARAIARIVYGDPVGFSYQLCLISVKACLVVAAVARVSYLARVLYENRMVPIRVILWVPACAAAAAWIFLHEQGLQFQIGLAITPLPILFLFHPCFELAAKCLPEANLRRVFQLTKRLIKHAWRKTKTYFKPNL